MVKLKKELQEYHARFLNFPSHNNNDRDDLVYIILENTTGTIPKMLADNVVWMCKDYKDRLTGWCSLLELVKVISEADISSKNNVFRDCKLSILRVDLEVSRNPFGAVTEVPSIIPILSGDYRPYIDATSEKNINFRIFTTLEQKYRDMLLSVLDGFQEWEEIESEGLNGYYLL